MTLGYPVIYYTAEMGTAAIMERVDAAVSRTPIGDLLANAQFVSDCVVDFAASTGSELRVKYVHPGSTTVDDLEEDLKSMALDGFQPRLVIVDYGDLLTSSRSSKGEKRHEELGAVYTDLRRMAVTWKVPVWTASQAKREALEKEVVTIADVGESYKKVQIADVVVALCGTEEERQQKILRMYVAACRFASGGVGTGPMKSAFEQGRIWDDINSIGDDV
jgi:replicative DNA helicase